MDFYRRFTFLVCAPAFAKLDLEGLRRQQIISAIELLGVQVAALMLLGALQSAQAAGLNIDHRHGDEIDGWAIGYSKLINGCLAAKTFENQSTPTTLWLGLGDSRLGAYLAFSNPTWSWIEVGKTYELSLKAVPYGAWRGNFVGIQLDKGKGLASLALNYGFQYDVVHAYDLHVDFGPAYARTPYEITNIGFPLKGADTALRAVRECQSQRGTLTDLPDPRGSGGSLGPISVEPDVRSGTGFFASTDGFILTNHHVVEGCLTVKLLQSGAAPHEGQVKATDKENDLALIYTDLKPAAAPALRADAALGETVEVYGFPLPGVIAQSGSFTVGNVSALAGVSDDTRKLQMSAPIQRGNSGGPLLDQFGNVVGVVQATLSSVVISQNVNFAIKASLAISFLKANNIEPNLSASTTPMGTVEIAGRAKLFTIQILCRPEPSSRPSPSSWRPTPQQKRVVVHLTQPVRQGAAPDLHSGNASPQDVIPKDTVFELQYTNLYTECRQRYSFEAKRMVFCPITYNNRVEWINAFHLQTEDGPLSCLIDPMSSGCDRAK